MFQIMSDIQSHYFLRIYIHVIMVSVYVCTIIMYIHVILVSMYICTIIIYIHVILVSVYICTIIIYIHVILISVYVCTIMECNTIILITKSQQRESKYLCKFRLAAVSSCILTIGRYFKR